MELFSKTPFINGGLFDCLDSLDATGAGGYHIDCFSDNRNHRSLLSIPNRLFFSDAPQGNERGLIDLFNRYKFTVEENTPTEQEVALDPELLGKVFENLLAAVNPETQLTARKETGSYYTPRAVVDYMVDEALVATMAQRHRLRTETPIAGRPAYATCWTTATLSPTPTRCSPRRNVRPLSESLLASKPWTPPSAPAPSPWASCTSSPWPCAGWTTTTNSGKPCKRKLAGQRAVAAVRH